MERREKNWEQEEGLGAGRGTWSKERDREQEAREDMRGDEEERERNWEQGVGKDTRSNGEEIIQWSNRIKDESPESPFAFPYPVSWR